MCTVSKHAERKIRQRLGLKKKAVRKKADQAFAEGLVHADTRGRLKRYLDRAWLRHRQGNNMRVLHGYIYIFHNDVLITVYRLPGRLKAQRIKQAEGAA